MKPGEQVRILARYYNTSVRTMQLLIESGLIDGAMSIKHTKRHAFVFSPELTDQLKKWSDKQ